MVPLFPQNAPGCLENLFFLGSLCGVFLQAIRSKWGSKKSRSKPSPTGTASVDLRYTGECRPVGKEGCTKKASDEQPSKEILTNAGKHLQCLSLQDPGSSHRDVERLF